MKLHTIAFILGFVLDLIFGDPYNWPHPIRWIGNLISICEKKFNKKEYDARTKRKNGLWTVCIVCLVTILFSSILLYTSYLLHPLAGVLVESVMTYYILAIKSLKEESMKVYYSLEQESIEKSRYQVSMIVGRDTQHLNDEQITKAAVETVAENTSDGIIAPMFYCALGGPVLGFLYKAINTMDSMIGYKNDKYLDYGRFAAKLDDVVNFIPSRLSAILLIVSTVILGKEFSTKNAIRIFKRDRLKHASPNSAQTESVCAGALQIQLAGPSSYFGKVVEKPYIGDPIRKIEHRDIILVNRMLYMSSFLFELICVIWKG